MMALSVVHPHRPVCKSTSEVGTPLYTGQPAGSQQCPLQRGSTLYRTPSWVLMVPTIVQREVSLYVHIQFNSIFILIRTYTETLGCVHCQEVPHSEKLHVVVSMPPQVDLCVSCPISSSHLSLSHHCQCMHTFSMPFELYVVADDAVDILDFTFCIGDKS